MQIKKAYRYRLVPTLEQIMAFEQYAGCCRFVWNFFLSQREAWYQSGAHNIPAAERDISVNPNGYAKQCKQLPPLKSFYLWLKAAPSQCLQQTLKDLDRAYNDFFKGQKGYPKFRKRGLHDSFRFPDPKGFAIDHAKKAILLPKVGWVKLRLSQKVKGELKNITISRRGKNWYASIQVEEKIELKKAPETSIGIDLGVSDMAAFSDGSARQALDFSGLEKLKLRTQRQLSKKRKGSLGWKRARERLSRVHEKIANKRLDHLHKLSSEICKNHALIVVEKLDVKKMSQSAKGSLEHPGKSVQSKAQLNRRILAQGWGEFIRQLDYKSSWKGGQLLKVDPQYTSQRCHSCGGVNSKNRLGKRFKCIACGYEEDADVNAARNILAAGHAATACGGSAFRRPTKQEPELIVRSALLEVGTPDFKESTSL